MPTEAQRSAMLAAMGIAEYRLRVGAASSATIRIGVDAHACVCVDGGESAGHLFALLPASLGVARERVRDAAAPDGVIEIDASCLHGDARAKRALWSALKPLARRLRGAD